MADKRDHTSIVVCGHVDAGEDAFLIIEYL